jgi:hypothetical protein
MNEVPSALFSCQTCFPPFSFFLFLSFFLSFLISFLSFLISSLFVSCLFCFVLFCLFHFLLFVYSFIYSFIQLFIIHSIIFFHYFFLKGAPTTESPRQSPRKFKKQLFRKGGILFVFLDRPPTFGCCFLGWCCWLLAPLFSWLPSDICSVCVCCFVGWCCWLVPSSQRRHLFRPLAVFGVLLCWLVLLVLPPHCLVAVQLFCFVAMQLVPSYLTVRLQWGWASRTRAFWPC